MKVIILRAGLFLPIMIFFVGLSVASNNIDWSKMNAKEIEALRLQKKLKKRENDILRLREAKLFITSGNIEMARYNLAKIDDKNFPLEIVKKRYSAILNFIEGNYEKSLSELTDHRFNELNYYKKICPLKLMNLFALGNDDNLRKETYSCLGLTSNFSKNYQMWITNILAIKKKDFRLLKQTTSSDVQLVRENNEMTKIWLKSGIYSNLEKILEKNISSLPFASYKSKKIRELIGLMYYRLGNNEKATSFIEDINSTNAENIRGNIKLSNKEYELAFGHFKLALKKKANSFNALERSIPLAWKLGLWQSGIDLLVRKVDDEVDRRNKIALIAAFKIRQKKFREAENNLRVLHKLFSQHPPKTVGLMRSYTTMMLGDTATSYEMAEQSCQRFDGASCWLKMQDLIWEDLSKTIKRDEQILSKSELSIDGLKETGKITPITEESIVDQKDIEELDSTNNQLRLENQT